MVELKSLSFRLFLDMLLTMYNGDLDYELEIDIVQLLPKHITTYPLWPIYDYFESSTEY